MKKSRFLFIVAILLVFIYSCSSNGDFSKDIAGISESMCRNIEVMNKLKAVNPSDSEAVRKLQSDVRQVQTEMTALYKEFEAKYKDRMKNDKFSKSFARELRKSMLDCPHLSKKDRENFERELAD